MDEQQAISKVMSSNAAAPQKLRKNPMPVWVHQDGQRAEGTDVADRHSQRTCSQALRGRRLEGTCRRPWLPPLRRGTGPRPSAGFHRLCDHGLALPPTGMGEPPVNGRASRDLFPTTHTGAVAQLHNVGEDLDCNLRTNDANGELFRDIGMRIQQDTRLSVYIASLTANGPAEKSSMM